MLFLQKTLTIFKSLSCCTITKKCSVERFRSFLAHHRRDEWKISKINIILFEFDQKTSANLFLRFLKFPGNSWQRLLLLHHRLEQSWIWQTSSSESEKGAEQMLCFGIDTSKEGIVLQVLKQSVKYNLENIINWTSNRYVKRVMNKWCLQPEQIYMNEWKREWNLYHLRWWVFMQAEIEALIIVSFSACSQKLVCNFFNRCWEKLKMEHWNEAMNGGTVKLLYTCCPTNVVEKMLKCDHSNECCWRVLPTVLFIMQCKVVWSFESLNEILKWDHLI